MPLSKLKEKVIVIDDDPDVLNSLRFLLEAEGFDVMTFASGHEVVEGLPLPPRGCLIVDYHMPNMSGLELLGQLRERQISLPAILITGYPDNLISIQAATLNIACVLLKPRLQHDLVLRLRELFADLPSRGPYNLRKST